MAKCAVAYTTVTVLLIIASSLDLTDAAVEADEVKDFPGFGPPPTKHYSGYVTVLAKTKRRLHYLYVESAAG